MMDPINENALKREEPENLLFGLTAQRHEVTVLHLRNGLLLLDIVRAIMAAKGGETPALGYATQGSMLVYRTNSEHVHINLRKPEIVGLFYSGSSSRSPLNNNGRSYFSSITSPVPESLQPELQLIAATFKRSKESQPWITTALWSEDGQLVTPGSWDSFLEHGGWAIERLLMDHKPALRGYQRVYGLSDAHAELAAVLFERKIERQRDWVLLSEAEFAVLISDGHAGLATTTEILLNNRIHQPYRVS